MLVNPEIRKNGEMDSFLGGASELTHIEGFIMSNDWNPEFRIPKIKKQYSFTVHPNEDEPEFEQNDMRGMIDWSNRGLPSFGVVDSLEQYDELFGNDLRAGKKKFFVSFVEIRRDEQPSSGGWRYHKWGEYYGTQNPEAEYLYDDKHIEKVYTFGVHELED